ncbi:MAG: hypothetical protein EAZ16_05100 [Sphingobacteriales bacterium]|nr:MAG: hypothetical protein EAZ16_05100 [Sphingobacteriales bacterium]
MAESSYTAEGCDATAVAQSAVAGIKIKKPAFCWQQHGLSNPRKQLVRLNTGSYASKNCSRYYFL